jgi:hypothetical protein
MNYFSDLFGKELYVFRTDLLSIISSLDTVFTAIGICHTIYVDCFTILARCSYTVLYKTSMTNTSCCEYCIKTPDDRQ